MPVDTALGSWRMLARLSSLMYWGYIDCSAFIPSAYSLRPSESGPNWVQLVLAMGSANTRGHGGGAL